uniref:Uncharacterized protein n=1 Tax=Solanum lycopersicum TaxID=4081 RepID=K4BCU3_SOLLC
MQHIPTDELTPANTIGVPWFSLSCFTSANNNRLRNSLCHRAGGSLSLSQWQCSSRVNLHIFFLCFPLVSPFLSRS